MVATGRTGIHQPTPTAITILSIDPGTRSLGYALWKQDAPVLDGIFSVDWEAPSEFLVTLRGFLDDMHAAHSIEFLAIERMFVSSIFGGNSAALLNVIPIEVRAWCLKNGVTYQPYGNSTVKRIVAGEGGASKDAVKKAVAGYISDTAIIDYTKKQLEDIADAHAIALCAIVSKYKPAAKAKPKKKSPPKK